MITPREVNEALEELRKHPDWSDELDTSLREILKEVHTTAYNKGWGDAKDTVIEALGFEG